MIGNIVGDNDYNNVRVLESGTFIPMLNQIDSSNGNDTTSDLEISYSKRQGEYIKLFISEILSLVLIDLNIEGFLTSNNSSNSYARISGLPFTVSDKYATHSIVFNNFYNAIAYDHPLPSGLFMVNSKLISIRNCSSTGGRGANSERFVANLDREFIITGNGYYYTNE